jgi:uncharacterized membrane protein (DUF4010 family)
MGWEFVVPFAVAALGGATVGLERQTSGHADGPSARFAGIRTFTLVGLLGAVAGTLTAQGHELSAAAVLVACGAMIAAAYVAAARVDVDGTTEVAALVVLAAGTLAGLGQLSLAGGVVAVTALLLVEKSRLHALAARVDDSDLRSGLRFAAMALVILPALPAGPFGPGIGVRPRELWALVLFFSGLSFAGHLAQRAVGPSRGLTVAGALGGLVSSTNVTLTFARASRQEPAHAGGLAAGALAANAMLFPRVLLATAVLNPPLALDLAPRLVPALAVTALAAWVVARRNTAPATSPATSNNPLKVGPALQMAALFQVVLYVVDAARTWFGAVGVIGSAAVLGVTDVDALTVTMARGAVEGHSPDVAARAIAVGILANTGLKVALALGLGAGAFQRSCGLGLAAAAGGLGAVLWVW